MTNIAQKASKAENVCDGPAGQKTSEIQAKGAKKKHLHSPRLGLAFRKVFRHKVCILVNSELKKNPGLQHVTHMSILHIHPAPLQWRLRGGWLGLLEGN